MALYAGPRDSARNRIVHSVSSARSGAAEWIDTIGKAHAAKIAADRPSQRGNLAAARLTSIADAIEEQLP
jgi:hypothetical protein